MIRFMTGDWSKVPEYLQQKCVFLGDAKMTEKQLIQLGRSVLNLGVNPRHDVFVFTNIEAVFLGLRLEVKERQSVSHGLHFDHYHEDGTTSSPCLRFNGTMNAWPPGFFEENDKALRLLNERPIL